VKGLVVEIDEVTGKAVEVKRVSMQGVSPEVSEKEKN
jgi:hypothetical protein